MTNLSTAVTVIDAAGRARVSSLLWSEPGKGKTSLVTALANADKVPLQVLIGSQREPADVGGWPWMNPDTGVLTKSVPDWADPLLAEGGGYLLLDELTTAPPAVQAAMLTVALERIAGPKRLPEAVRIVAAANPPDCAAGGVDLTAPMANRFLHIDFEPSTDEWLTGMRGGFVTPASRAVSADPARIAEEVGLVAAFIESRPDLLHRFPENEADAGRAWPSRRSWAATAKVLAYLRPDDDAAQHTTVFGLVGTGAGSEYVEWRAKLDLPPVLDVLADPAVMDWAGARPDQVWAVLSAVTAWAAGQGSQSAWTEAWGPLVAAATGGAPDVAGAAARALAVARPAKAKVPASARRIRDVMIAAGLDGEAAA